MVHNSFFRRNIRFLACGGSDKRHIQQYFSFIVAVNSICGGKREYPEETTDLPEFTDKLYYIMLHRVHLAWSGFELTTLVVIGTDCIGSCKSNYHTITTALMKKCTPFKFEDTKEVTRRRKLTKDKQYNGQS
jgi:hypothetical protein